MADIKEWLLSAVEKGASDIFIGVGRRVSFKIDGVLTPQSESGISPGEAEEAIRTLYEMANRSMDTYNESGDDDFPVPIPGVARFRVNIYRQRATMAAVIRVVHFSLPDHEALKIPDGVMGIAEKHHGLVLVTGSTGSGKSTTLACIIDKINKTRSCHIITLEDPIEFLHRDDKSIISQRDISTDTKSYLSALRACLRQAPDIILLGEMRDHETIGTAVTAAETGQLVISTLHTTGAVNTIDRIIDVFPPEQQQQIRIQLSMTLQTVVTQKLVPNKTDGLVPAFEILHVNSAVRNLIREAKTHQIDNIIQTSSREGMISMDTYIYKLYQDGEVTAEAAMAHAMEPDQMTRRINAKQ